MVLIKNDVISSSSDLLSRISSLSKELAIIFCFYVLVQSPVTADLSNQCLRMRQRLMFLGKLKGCP